MRKSKFTLITVILLSFLILLSACSPKTNEVDGGQSQGGEYTAEEEGFGGAVSITIKLGDDGKITEGKVEAKDETLDIGGEAAPKILEEIINSQSLEVDTISGATVTSNAVKKATEAALLKAGVDISKFKSEVASGDDEEIDVDVVIVGAGASGTTAALAAIESGAKVLMVEKTGGIGGVSKFWAGGPFAIETEIQKEAGYDLKKEDALQTLIDYSHFISYAPLQKAILWKSADTIDWLTGYGVNFYANLDTPQIAHRDDPMKWQNYHWYEQFGQEVASLDILHEKLDEMGLDLRLNTTATSLIKDDNGEIKGIIASREDGSKLTVNANAVVLGTGGYSGNSEMMEEAFHTPYIGAWGPTTGDGLKMAWDAGAAKWDMQSALLHGSGIVPGPNKGDIDLGTSPFNQITRSPLLWIDQSGNRFCNEETVYDTAYTSNVGYSVGGMYYIVVDKSTLDAYSNGDHLVMDPAVGGPNMDQADFIELAEEGVKQGNIFKGNTLEELAANTGMDEERLKLNIEEYNESIKSKKDHFGKSAENLEFQVSEGPFYAVKMMISNLGTTGGVRANEKLEAADIDLKPIPGLYVVGNDAGGYYGNITSYPPYEGLATGFALNSGRIGGESAAEYALKNK